MRLQASTWVPLSRRHSIRRLQLIEPSVDVRTSPEEASANSHAECARVLLPMPLRVQRPLARAQQFGHFTDVQEFTCLHIYTYAKTRS